MTDVKKSLYSSSYFALITPSDTDSYPQGKGPPRAIEVGGAGNLVVENDAGETVTIAVAAGWYRSISPTKVKAATTATAIIGYW